MMILCEALGIQVLHVGHRDTAGTLLSIKGITQTPLTSQKGKHSCFQSIVASPCTPLAMQLVQWVYIIYHILIKRSAAFPWTLFIWV